MSDPGDVPLSAKPYQRLAVALWSFALAAYCKAAAAQEETWPTVKEATVTENPRWCFTFEGEGGENLTAAVLSPASRCCAMGSFSLCFLIRAGR